MVFNIPVSLSEVVEVRGNGLAEEEAWAVLSKAITSLTSLVSDVRRSEVEDCSLTSDTVFLLSSGDVQLKPMHKSGLDEVVLPPEYSSDVENNNNENYDSVDLSKIFIYSLGALLLNSVFETSQELLSLLNLMTVKDMGNRPSLSRLKQVTEHEVRRRNLDCSLLIQSMHSSIMGSQEDNDLLPNGSTEQVYSEFETNDFDSRVVEQINEVVPETVFTKESVPEESDAPMIFDVENLELKDKLDEDEKLRSSLEIELKSKDTGKIGDFPEELSPIGTPVGNSTADVETLNNNYKANTSWISFDKSLAKSGDNRTREDSFLSSTSPEEDLGESVFNFSPRQPESGHSPPSVSREREKFSPFTDPSSNSKRASVTASVFEKIMPQGGMKDFTSPKDHGRFEKSRSCHSLDCQFCSPNREFAYKNEGEKNSLPNLVSTALCLDPSQVTPKPAHKLYSGEEKRRISVNVGQSENGQNLFDGFEDLAHPDSEVNDRQSRSVRLASVVSGTNSEEAGHGHSSYVPASIGHVSVEMQEMEESGFPDSRKQSPPVGNFKRRNSSRRLSSSSRKRPKEKAGNSVPFQQVSADGVILEPLARPRKKDVMRSEEVGQRVEGMGGPEFLQKSRLPSIRLKAPARKKAKLLHRSEPSSVQVVLLSGQRVEVSCRTDSTASDVFDSVVAHTDLTEHYFFGITILKDGEHFFLETDQKLHKYSPPGWRNQRKHPHARNVYTLYLRLKYYPSTLDYIKTGHTLHEMYLQLRRDIIDERLQVSRDAAYQLAALALQAEYGDRPSESASYFNSDHYMPHRHLMEELGGEERIRSILAELHTQYSGMMQQEAETEYLKMCQSQREYGIHFHRLYRTKQSQNLTPSPLGDPETGTPLWIGIMPRGIIIFEEQSGNRVPISQHPWHLTETLQFNRKKFVIVPQNAQFTSDVGAHSKQPPTKKIFYTDNYKKSSYFVKFAGTQHRFGIKMRGWAATLSSDQSQRSDSGLDTRPRVVVPRNGDSMGSSVKSNDSGVPGESREASPDEKIASIVAAKKASKSPIASRPVPPPRGSNRTSKTSGSSTGVPEGDFTTGTRAIDVNVPANDRTWNITRATDESVSASLKERFDQAAVSPDFGLNPVSPSDYSIFVVNLTKDPRFGLGLTLVDGEIQGMKGVYVKSLTSDGPAQLQGRLRIGDKLLEVNYESLENKNRHDAVNLVRQSGMEVEMKILRLKGLYTGSDEDDSLSAVSPSMPSSSSVAARNRSRTMSDVSSGGPPVALPPYSSQDIFAGLKKEEAERKYYSRDSVEVKKSETLPPVLDSSKFLADEEGKLLRPQRRTMSSMTAETHSSTSSRRSSHSSGEFRPVHSEEPGEPAVILLVNDSAPSRSGLTEPGKSPQKTPRPASMYAGLDASDSEEGTESFLPGENENRRRRSSAEKENVDSADGFLPGFETNELIQLEETKVLAMGGSQLDWTDDISLGDISNVQWKEPDDEDLDEVTVTLEKNEKGSLGIKIAGGNRGQKRIYIKALVADPALSCANLRPGDRLVSVNGRDTRDMFHRDVVELLRDASSPVTLGLLRIKTCGAINDKGSSEEESDVQTLTVSLEKPVSGSLGLSLARPAGGEGIYIRVINSDSVAAEDGQLKVGDRLWEINGESVAKASPLEVVEKLKAAEGFVHLIVKRESTSLIH